MLAAAQIPEEYVKWNQHWAAPFGRVWSKLIPRTYRALPGIANLCGFFAFQTNNDTRIFEYPWACSMLQVKKGMEILEIGGGISGFQFVLDRTGCHVTNVDPGLAARGKGWPVTPDVIATLNKHFGTCVELMNCFIDEAGIEDESQDRVVSISTIEHIPDDDIRSILSQVRRVLKPGGLFVITLDLFLDIEPFATATTNHHGKNISAKWLVEQSGLTLVHGSPAELYGFHEFNPDEVRKNHDKYLVGNGYPVMVQAIVLQK